MGVYRSSHKWEVNLRSFRSCGVYERWNNLHYIIKDWKELHLVTKKHKVLVSDKDPVFPRDLARAAVSFWAFAFADLAFKGKSPQ